MSNAVVLKRGEQAEHCPRCKVNVMPVAAGNGGSESTWRWVCPYCRTETVPHV